MGMGTPSERQSPSGCRWHPALRWFLFLPAGCVAMGLARVIVLFVWWNSHLSAWGLPDVVLDYCETAAEPWGFLAGALWVLPSFHRAFTWAFVIIYPTVLFVVCWAVAPGLVSSFTFIGFPAVSLASGIIAARLYLPHYTTKKRLSCGGL